ncbi:MAG: histidine kinase N-terminal 7TM domain-containing protein, partial [Patescibacteria group bacterium]
MFIFSYTAAILSIIFFVFALVILLKVKNSYQAIFLALYMLAVALWIGANAAADVSSTDSSLIFWTGMGSVGGSFFISFYLCFVDNFIHEHFPKKLNILLYLLPGVILSLFSFSHYSIVATFFPPNLPAQIIPGILFYFYLVFLFGGLLYGGIRLAIAYRNALSQKKKQILYMELGFISIFCGAAIFSLILPLFGELRFFTAGPQFAAFTIFFTAYAIFRHKLLDLRIIIQRGLIYTVLFAIIVLFYLTILFIAQSIFVGGSRTIYVFTAIITCVVGIFSVPKLDNWLRRVTDRVFFKDRYDS